jgi:hypothetical protein
MRFNISFRKKTAVGLLIIWIVNLFLPTLSFALTSGPSQPESRSFQPAGVSDMVDLFSGDFKYNIPLLEVDGYPINLNYQSGSGIDDEASWVGLGWNLNVGAINRQLRGIPDDLSGDIVTTEHYTKPKITVGGRVTAKVEAFGKQKLPGINGSVTLGIFSDNYTGVGAEVGANAGISYSFANSGALTAGMGASVLSSTVSGVDFSPYMSLSIKNNSDADLTSRAGLSASSGYNSRSGMKSMTLGTSFSASSTADEAKKWSTGFNPGGSTISYNSEPVNPRIQVPYDSRYGSFSFDFGGVAWAIFGGGGGTGYKSVRSIVSRVNTNAAYGFLYAERGKRVKTAVMDFNREKDNPIIPDIPNIALPVHSPDLFSYTSQAGGGQFRLYRGGTGAFFDNEVEDKSSTETLGGDVGVGGYAHGGVTHFEQETKNVTRKWTAGKYIEKGDFQDVSPSNPADQHVYFRMVGEKNVSDKKTNAQFFDEKPLAIKVGGMSTKSAFRDNSNYFASNLPVTNVIKKQQRRVNRTAISYLTAGEARRTALNINILSYPFNNFGQFIPTPVDSITPTIIDRVGDYRKAHHISEMSVTDEAGKRMIYGIPVYNKAQEEYSFAVGIKRNSKYPGGYRLKDDNKTLIALSGFAINNRGVDHYFHKESQAAYASSYLLTAVLSPDFVDKTGDGISKDDLGTAIKFNYSKLASLYKWRTPYSDATLNKSMLADPEDDKGSFVYGEKELWYAHSVESKTKVAFFITQDRDDALGVVNFMGGKDLSNRQKCLKEIRLYSKSDMSKPIKVVKFDYEYDLCPGVPNSLNSKGKLKLTRVYFQYANSDKGKFHPYTFKYITQIKETINNTSNIVIPEYGYMKTDRWGTYKSHYDNEGLFDLANDEFPYTIQDTAKANANVALWQLDEIDLPTGGTIKVNYESDDYAFVQNRRAMVMSGVEALIDGQNNPLNTSSLKQAKGIKIKISNGAPQGVQTRWFKANYLSGSEYIYTKLHVKLSTINANSYGEDFDFVSCYAKVSNVTIDGTTAFIKFEDINESGVSVNPIILAAWQRMKNEYPRYAYPGYESRVKDKDAGKALKAAVVAIINAFGNLRELKRNFYEKANERNYASQINLKKSFVRITKFNGFKIGGGHRVKKIQIKDNWDTMSGGLNVPSGVYGQAYDYTTIYDKQIISSGVAAYEPSVGSDENPLKQPVPYVQKIKGAINNYFSLEEPFGESFYPGPSVGYSKVTVRDLNSDGVADPLQRTGFIENEFFTAREFPVQVTVLPLEKYEYRPKNWYSMLGSSSLHHISLSQGYSIELNDMHGKPHATRIYNQSGAEISSEVYHYNSTPIAAGESRLTNLVDVINQDGTIETDQIIGREIEFFTDLREQESINKGNTINIGGDVVPLPFFGFPFPIPHWPRNINDDYKLFRSACAVKVIQSYGVIDSVVKTQNGSSVTTENLAYDAITGEVLVTRTQNEFNDYIYSVNLPAYWVYKGMGGAYQNLGMLMSNLRITNGNITSGFSTLLQPGDEIGDLETGNKYWVILGGNTQKQLIDREGKLLVSLTIANAKLIRSGFKNMLMPATSTMVCLENPVIDGRLQLSAPTLKVINATANIFDEKWSVDSESASSQSTRKYLIENTSHSFDFAEISGNSYKVISKGVYLEFVNANNTGPLLSSGYWSGLIGPFSRSSVWPRSQGSAGGEHVESLSLDTCITIAESKYYYVGAGSSDQISYSFDNNQNGQSISGFANRWVVNKHYLTAGSHRFRINVYTSDNDPSDDFAGLELYNNTLEQLRNADASGTGINILFSTGGLRNKADVKTKRIVYTNGVVTAEYYHYAEPDGTPADPCYEYSPAPLKRIINPYLFGYLGNWRPSESLVYQEKRHYSDLFDNTKKGIDIKNSGYLASFFSYWSNPSSGNDVWLRNSNPGLWVTANTVTLYDKYGQELENRDALGRYSSARFDFNGELPAAVASNAMNREMYVTSFEDSKFASGSSDAQTKDFTRIEDNKNLRGLTTSTDAHTGNYSLQLPLTGIALTTLVHNKVHKTESYIEYVAGKGYMTKTSLGLYPGGFQPSPGKKYIFSMWVKDSQPSKTTVPVEVKINKALIALKCKAIAEGWKLIEGVIDLKQLGDVKGIAINVLPSMENVLADDVRIFPFDAHMKSYAYDDKTLRLMAELDENSFATFYEYDDEGSLVRVKKETERGIVTLKETRSSYMRRN